MATRANRRSATETQNNDEIPLGAPVDPYKARMEALAARISGKHPTARIETGATEDQNPTWIIVPDLQHQAALGRHGYACGRINYILGAEGSSKTSKMLYLCNLAIEAGGYATIVEWEGAMDPAHIAKYVRNPDKLQIIHAECLEDGMEISRMVLNDYGENDPEGILPKVLGADSIGGSVMRRALDEKVELGDNRVGGPGLYMSSAVPYINNMCVRTKTLWVIIGQAREEIPTGFSGPPKPYIERITGKGGKAAPFHATYWEILQRRGTLKGDDGKTGFTVESTFKKNKKGVQWRSYFYDISFAPGENIVYKNHTLTMLTVGNVGGLRVRPAGNQGKRYGCEAIGIPSTPGLSADEMYALIHSPEHIGHFQEALGIKTDAKSIVQATASDLPPVADEVLLATEPEHPEIGE